jgi:Tol biopolymer transport system component
MSGNRISGLARLATPRQLAVAVAIACAATFVATGSATAAYPGPNGLIAFRAMLGDRGQVFTIDPVTLAQVQLTDLTDGDAVSSPHWSPDNAMITFEFDAANPTSSDFCNVATMNADGSDLTFLPLRNGDQSEASPAFSADGRRIFYEGYNGKHRDDIWSMNLDGSNRRLISACEGRGVTDPEPSPDGQMLAFTCFSRAGNALFDARVDGSHPMQLTPYSFGVGVHNDWSPDSRRIMFISTSDEGAPDAQINTATINADGTGLFWVTNYPAGGLRAYGNSYSPDGRWIVMRLEDGSQNALFEIHRHPDGSGLSQITPYSSFRPRGMVRGSAP